MTASLPVATPAPTLPRFAAVPVGAVAESAAPESDDAALFVGTDPGPLRPYFRDAREVGTVGSGGATGLDGEPVDTTRIWWLTGRTTAVGDDLGRAAVADGVVPGQRACCASSTHASIRSHHA